MEKFSIPSMNMKMFGSTKATEQDMALRLEGCLYFPENLVCAECPAKNPTWASILIPPAAMNASMFISSSLTSSLPNQQQQQQVQRQTKPVVTTSTNKKKWNHQKGKRILGVFICQKCSNFHIQMGRDVCEVKNTKVTEQCKLNLRIGRCIFNISNDTILV